ncbi:MAG: M48 family metallopeptidase [Bacillota bacterium]|nr:M48 family metallopeptidase [Bacillota bacterium]
MPQITVGTDSISYYLKKSVRAKRLRITVSLQGVTVTIPQHLEERHAVAFIEEKKYWVHNKFMALKVKSKQNISQSKTKAPTKELKLKAQTTIAARVDFYARKLGVEYNRVLIKDQKTRWGSCSNKKNLNFSWRLIMAPSEVLEYVVVHEICHLVYMNHSRDFWQLVAKLFPDYQQQRKWLRDYGQTLK